MRQKILNQVNKFCRRFGITVLYENQYGIKAFNPAMNSQLLAGYRERSVTRTDPQRLRLSVDGLKDHHTLLGCPVGQSPHFQLMTRLVAKEKVDRQCDYLQRLASGTLDFRRPQNAQLDLELFKHKQKAIRSDQYAPIFIYQQEGHQYIVDGKHRAALCLALKKPVKVIFVNDFIRDSHYFWLMQKMGRSKDVALFSEHLHFFGTIFPKIKGK